MVFFQTTCCCRLTEGPAQAPVVRDTSGDPLAPGRLATDRPDQDAEVGGSGRLWSSRNAQS